jgi:hypothetical protein
MSVLYRFLYIIRIVSPWPFSPTSLTINSYNRTSQVSVVFTSIPSLLNLTTTILINYCRNWFLNSIHLDLCFIYILRLFYISNFDWLIDWLIDWHTIWLFLVPSTKCLCNLNLCKPNTWLNWTISSCTLSKYKNIKLYEHQKQVEMCDFGKFILQC